MSTLTCFDYFGSQLSVSGRIRPHALSKGGAALRCYKESAECCGCISFYCHLGFLAVPRGSERFNLAGLEKRKEGRYFFVFFYVLLNSVQLQFII